ncbi:MAG: hypothetical protein E7Z87_04945 [Cyanobacteria bacterium SIG26]|nr:hypothetical protein [Cyanobacteria bacterium SIG26]
MVANIIGKGLSYAWRGLKATPHLIASEGGARALVTGVNRGLRQSTSSTITGTLWNGLKRGGKALEANKAASGGLWKAFSKQMSNLGPKALSSSWKAGATAAKEAGKSSLLGGLKGIGGNLSKAMPALGTAIMVAGAVPTVVTAFKNEGIIGGIKEIGKEGVKLGAGAIGAAIGSAFIPPFGTMLGWMAGSFVGSLFTGKSASEKQAEAEQLLAEQEAQLQQFQNVQQATFNPYANGGSIDTNAYKNTYAYQTRVVQNPYEQDILRRQMGFDTYI